MKFHKKHTLYTSPLYGLKHLCQLHYLLHHSRHFRNTNINLEYHYQLSTTAHREVFYPHDKLYNFHLALNKFLSKIEKPGFIKSGKKGESYLSHVQSHIDQNQYLSLDIQSYYANITRLDVFKFFRNNLNCSHEVSDYLAYFCTYKNQLPLGSPMSMNLAYLINEEMFYHLNQIAIRNNLTMTVYVDDIAFSGKLITSKVKYNIIGIIHKHGYSINKNKLRFYKNKKSYRETSGLIIHKNKLLPNKEKLEKLHLLLSSWSELTYLDDPFIVHYQFVKLIGFISYLCQIDNKYIQLKHKVMKEYKKLKEENLFEIYLCKVSEWNTLLSNNETSTKTINEKYAELNRLIKNLSNLNRKNLVLHKQIKHEYKTYKQIKAPSRKKLFNIINKFFD